MSPLRLTPGLEEYVEAHTTPVPDYLRALAAETRAHVPFPQMLSGAVEGRFLETLAYVADAKLALDVGTFTGNSALSLAAGIAPGGRVITLDQDEGAVAVARKYIERSPFADRIEIRLGPALDSIAALAGPFDIVFIDADKTNYINYYEAVLPKLAPRGLIVADNTLWGEQVLDGGDTSPDTVAIRAFNDHVVQDDRVVCVQLTVRDGVTLIRRKP
jgi:caffeoyl-CoA O-methyltransferase